MFSISGLRSFMSDSIVHTYFVMSFGGGDGSSSMSSSERNYPSSSWRFSTSGENSASMSSGWSLKNVISSSSWRMSASSYSQSSGCTSARLVRSLRRCTSWSRINRRGGF